MTAGRLRWMCIPLVAGLLAVSAACGAASVRGSAGATARPSNTGTGAAPSGAGRPTGSSRPAPAAAPYLYLGADNVPDPRRIMDATGIRWFTLAFVLSHGPCDPQWDGTRPLLGGADERTIAAIRAAGGDVIVSSGGANGPWLEQTCGTAGMLAAAYQRVITAYRLKGIDVDIEGTVYGSPALQQRVIDALKIVRAADNGLAITVTFPAETSGADSGMIGRAAAAGLVVNSWTVMPFDMGAAGRNMGELAQQAADRVAATVKSAYGYPDDEAYRHTGISSMNGITDAHETVTMADFEAMLRYARSHHLARFTFWSANRDRPCTAASPAATDSCSGVPQSAWDFTRLVAQYGG